MTMRARWGKTVLLLTLASGWACARGPAPHGAARVAAQERIVCGLTGLQAGQGRGYIVYADGRVEAWTGRTIDEGIEFRGKVAASAVEDLWGAIRAANFYARDAQGFGSTAAFVQMDAADGTHRVSWAVGPGAEGADSTLTQVFDLCLETAGAAR